MKQHAQYTEERCHAFVCDISQKEWTVPFPSESLDVVILLFVMSALDPKGIAIARSIFKLFFQIDFRKMNVISLEDRVLLTRDNIP